MPEGIKPLTEEEVSDSSQPVDFSFKNVIALIGIGVEGPRSTRVGKIPERGVERRKYLTRAIWLNNNKLTNIKDVETMASNVLEQPEKLGWIDFSFNMITELDNGLLKLPNLKILYLHGNLLESMEDVYRIRNLSELRSLTMHGNPINEIPRYRNHVICYLPQLANLDFSPITNEERLQAKPIEAVRRIAQGEMKK